MENLNDFDIEKLKRLQYESQLDRFLKKDKVQLLFPNVRGASEELKNHIRILALDKIDKGLGVETLTRLKDICEYFISKKSNRRKSYDNDPTRQIYDKFTRYEEQLKQIEILLQE
jgi:hypothetical protein